MDLVILLNYAAQINCALLSDKGWVGKPGGVAAGMPGEAAAAPRRSDAAKSGAAAHRLAASARELRLQQHTNLLL